MMMIIFTVPEENGKKVLTMPKEYIEREAVIDLITRRYENPEICKAEINAIPAADVAPVRHARWERTADGAALCTACKRKMNPSQYGYAFCNLCGAKMDG